jgi:predicted DNA-binding transcriptional regulator AlpA
MTTPIVATPSATERLLDLEEVAKMLGGISTRSVRRLVARGDLPRPVKVLSSPRLYYSDILNYLDQLKQNRDNQTRRQGRNL